MGWPGFYAFNVEEAIRRMPKLTSICLTDTFSAWYYRDGPMSRDVEHSPFPRRPSIDKMGHPMILLRPILRGLRHPGLPDIKSLTSHYPLTSKQCNGIPIPAFCIGPRIGLLSPSGSRLFEFLEELSLDISLAQCSNDGHQRSELCTAFCVMLGKASRLKTLSLRFRDDFLPSSAMQSILVGKQWPVITKLSLEGVEMDLESIAGIVKLHATSLCELQLSFIVISRGTLLEMSETVEEHLSLEGIALMCFIDGREPHGSNSCCDEARDGCRRQDLEVIALSRRDSTLQGLQDTMKCIERRKAGVGRW